MEGVGVSVQNPGESILPKPQSYRDRLMEEGDDNVGDSPPTRLEEGGIEITKKESRLVVTTSEGFRQRMEEPWRKAVVVKLMGRSMGYRMLSNRVKELWNPHGSYRIIDLDNNFYLVQMALEEDV